MQVWLELSGGRVLWGGVDGVLRPVSGRGGGGCLKSQGGLTVFCGKSRQPESGGNPRPASQTDRTNQPTGGNGRTQEKSLGYYTLEHAHHSTALKRVLYD